MMVGIWRGDGKPGSGTKLFQGLGNSAISLAIAGCKWVAA